MVEKLSHRNQCLGAMAYYVLNCRGQLCKRPVVTNRDKNRIVAKSICATWRIDYEAFTTCSAEMEYVHVFAITQ